MANVTENVLIDNEAVKVTEVFIPVGRTHAPTSRLKRVIINLDESHIERHDADTQTNSVHNRDAGSVVFRDASSHEITNTGDQNHHSIVIELKD